MLNPTLEVIGLFASCSQPAPVVNIEDLRLSFYGYYYF